MRETYLQALPKIVEEIKKSQGWKKEVPWHHMGYEELVDLEDVLMQESWFIK